MARNIALVTGFEPYGGRGSNPSGEVARRLDGSEIDGVAVVGRTFPVSFRVLAQAIEQALAELDPVAVIGVGLWPGEATIRIERVAINVADFEIPDNDGELLVDQPLEQTPATARMATLPLRDIERALLAAGIPALISSSAGTFLCNATMFTSLGGLEKNGRDGVPCGFIHVPYAPEQVAGMISETREERSLELHQRADFASMGVDVMVEAVRVALAVTLAGRPAAAH
ncbi:MAG: pyroglutamyl-peptidase I [Alphaproteobacteria bacterium]